MQRVLVIVLILLAVTPAIVLAAVDTTSISGVYSFGYLDQDSEIYSGSSIGVSLRTSAFFKSMEKIGLRYDLRATNSMKLKENDNPAKDIKGFGIDLGVAFAYQQQLSYLSFVEAGVGLLAIGASKQYNVSGARKINQHLLLGVSAFLDYHYALQNKLALNIGASAKMPLVGFARFGAKENPKAGRITVKGLEISPHVGISFIF